MISYWVSNNKSVFNDSIDHSVDFSVLMANLPVRILFPCVIALDIHHALSFNALWLVLNNCLAVDSIRWVGIRAKTVWKVHVQTIDGALSSKVVRLFLVGCYHVFVTTGLEIKNLVNSLIWFHFVIIHLTFESRRNVHFWFFWGFFDFSNEFPFFFASVSCVKPFVIEMFNCFFHIRVRGWIDFDFFRSFRVLLKRTNWGISFFVTLDLWIVLMKHF